MGGLDPRPLVRDHHLRDLVADALHRFDAEKRAALLAAEERLRAIVG